MLNGQGSPGPAFLLTGQPWQVQPLHPRSQGIPAPPPTAQQEERPWERARPAPAGHLPEPVGRRGRRPSRERASAAGHVELPAGTPGSGGLETRWEARGPIASPSVPGRTPGPGPGQVRGPGAWLAEPARWPRGPHPALPARPAPVQPAGRPCDPGPGSLRALSADAESPHAGPGTHSLLEAGGAGSAWPRAQLPRDRAALPGLARSAAGPSPPAAGAAAPTSCPSAQRGPHARCPPEP